MFNGAAFSQMDFGLSLGAASYLGEIGGTTGEAKPWLLDMKLSQSNVAAGRFFRHDFTKSLSGKVSINYIRIEGADSLSDEPTRLGRNLSFRTDMIEAVVTAEFRFFQMRDLSRRSRQRIDFATYILAGAGILSFNPTAQDNEGNWVDLRPLQTEGPENAYEQTTIVVPVGAGAQFTFNKKFRLGVEFGYRFSSTDYLDDISTRYADPADLPFEKSIEMANRSAQAFAREDGALSETGLNIRNYDPGSIRGGADSNDGYLTAQVQLSYVLGGKNSFYKSRYNSIINRRRKRTKF